MIVPDVNLLIHAYNRSSPVHEAARVWWESLMNGNAPVGLTWIAAAGFIRITTNPRILGHPLPATKACSHVRSWLARPVVSILQPGPRHAELMFGFLESLGTAGNLTTDAQLAAIAVEFQAELQSTDADFLRFPGLKWKNPLA